MLVRNLWLLSLYVPHKQLDCTSIIVNTMKTRIITHLSLAFILSSFLLSSCENEELVDLIIN